MMGGGDKLYMYIQTILQQSSIRTQKHILSQLWECSVQVLPPLMVVFMGALHYGYIRAAAVRQFIQYLDWNFNFQLDDLCVASAANIIQST